MSRMGWGAVAVMVAAACTWAWAESPPVVRLVVSGLTKENEADAVRRLGEVRGPVWACAQHPDAQADRPGKCTACGAERAEGQEAAVQRVTADVEKRAVAVNVEAARTLRLTAVDAALAGAPVQLDRASLELDGTSVLYVSGMRCPN